LSLVTKKSKKIVASINKLRVLAGKPKQKEGDYTVFLPEQKLTEYIESKYYDQYSNAMHTSDKTERKDKLSDLKDELKKHLSEMPEDNEIKALYSKNPEYLLIVIDRLEEKNHEANGFKRKS